MAGGPGQRRRRRRGVQPGQPNGLAPTRCCGRSAPSACITLESKEIEKKIKKQAVLGITGAKKTLFDLFNSLTGNKTRTFNTEAEAKEWLIQ